MKIKCLRANEVIDYVDWLIILIMFIEVQKLMYGFEKVDKKLK